MKHHIWCNFQNPNYPELGAEDCEMCKGLMTEFPDSNEKTEQELQEKYFPNIVRVTYQ